MMMTKAAPVLITRRDGGGCRLNSVGRVVGGESFVESAAWNRCTKSPACSSQGLKTAIERYSTHYLLDGVKRLVVEKGLGAERMRGRG
jgi:hypothetical protein